MLRQQKDKRRATNKGRTGFRFYDMVDTKNRNRDRKKTKKTVPKSERRNARKDRKHNDSD